MKARITVDQVAALTDNGKKRLKKWWKIRAGDWFVIDGQPEYELMQWGAEQKRNTGEWFRLSGLGQPALPLMDITMMIRFLSQMANRKAALASEPMQSYILDFPAYEHGDDIVIAADLLCDDLWDMVKEILDNETT